MNFQRPRRLYIVVDSAGKANMPPKASNDGMCISMHQPWASLLVYGIKRIEGRGWPTEHRGRLWIHATSKVPVAEEIQELEAFYRGVHAMEGSQPGPFPADYPTSVLLGCVEVVNCLTAEQVEAWDGLPQSVKLEVGSPHCFLCERPQRLVVLHPMRGWPKLFPLEHKMLRIASIGLKPAPSGPDAFSWARFGAPPAASSSLPPSTNKFKFAERMGQTEGQAAEERGGGGQGKAARSEGCTSPRSQRRSGEQLLGGAALPRAVALNKQQQQQQHEQQHGQPRVQQQQQRTAEAAGGQGDASRDPAKRLRTVQKKLRQIATLQEKQQAGVELTVEEEGKLKKLAQLQAEEAALQHQL